MKNDNTPDVTYLLRPVSDKFTVNIILISIKESTPKEMKIFFNGILFENLFNVQYPNNSLYFETCKKRETVVTIKTTSHYCVVLPIDNKKSTIKTFVNHILKNTINNILYNDINIELNFYKNIIDKVLPNNDDENIVVTTSKENDDELLELFKLAFSNNRIKITIWVILNIFNYRIFQNK